MFPILELAFRMRKQHMQKMPTPYENGPVFGFKLADTSTVITFRVIFGEMRVRFLRTQEFHHNFCLFLVCYSNQSPEPTLKTIQKSQSKPKPVNSQRASAFSKKNFLLVERGPA